MATLIPTAYELYLSGLRVEVIRHGAAGWCAYTAVRHLTVVGPGATVWERTGGDHGPTIFPTAQSAAEAAENARWP